MAGLIRGITECGGFMRPVLVSKQAAVAGVVFVDVQGQPQVYI
jgi:hypothetical protein